jgi:hypothetical protein
VSAARTLKESAASNRQNTERIFDMAIINSNGNTGWSPEQLSFAISWTFSGDAILHFGGASVLVPHCGISSLAPPK